MFFVMAPTVHEGGTDGNRGFTASIGGRGPAGVGLPAETHGHTMRESMSIVVPRIGLVLRVFGIIFAVLSVGMIAAPALEDPLFVQAEPEKYARIAFFGKVALPFCVFAIVLRVEWVLQAGSISRRVGLLVPMFRTSVRLPAQPRVVCRKQRGRGTSGTVYVSHPVTIEGPDAKDALMVKRFGQREGAEADAFAATVSELMGIRRESEDPPTAPGSHGG